MKNYVKLFIEDMKYYDPEKKEIGAIIENINLNGKTVLDIGAGAGRLSFPISAYAKEVVALDMDKRFKKLFKNKKVKNLSFVNQKAEEYLQSNREFDIILLAWPTIDSKLIRLIKNSMTKRSLLIFTTCDNNSEYETIIDKIKVFEKNNFKDDIKNKLAFLALLPNEFKLVKKILLKTEFVYPDKDEAFRTIKNSLKLWFNVKFRKETNENLRELILRNNKEGEIRFGEMVWFYILKLK